MRHILFTGLLVLLVPLAARAQQVEGRVVNDEDDSPVAGATVVLEDTAGGMLRRVVADDAGRFRLWHNRPGSFRLTVERIGYATVAGHPIRLDSAGVVEVEVRMRPEAVAIEPIRVLARREVARRTVDQFYERMERLADRGHFMTREDIEASNAPLPALALAFAPSTWVRGSKGSIQLMNYGQICSPAIYLNGLPLPTGFTLNDAVTVDQIEGVEIYRGYFVPETFATTFDGAGCGMILVWSNTQPDPRFVPTWGRLLGFGVLGGAVLGLGLLF